MARFSRLTLQPSASRKTAIERSLTSSKSLSVQYRTFHPTMFNQLKKLFAITDTEQIVPAQRLAELAATALLLEVSHADHHVDTAETEAILAIAQKTFGLVDQELDDFFSTAELKKSDSISLYEFTDVINQDFDATQKFQLIVDCWRIAYADGNIDRYEDHTIRKIAELIYVSHSDFVRAKHRAVPANNRTSD